MGNPEADRNKSLSVTVYLTKSEFVKQKNEAGRREWESRGGGYPESSRLAGMD